MSNPNPSLETRWKPGQSGNPKGRPRGSRDEVNEEVFQAFLVEWRKRGADALSALSPQDLARIAVQMLSKESKVEHSGGVAHEHTGLPETARWLEGISGTRPEPLPN